MVDEDRKDASPAPEPPQPPEQPPQSETASVSTETTADPVDKPAKAVLPPPPKADSRPAADAAADAPEAGATDGPGAQDTGAMNATANKQADPAAEEMNTQAQAEESPAKATAASAPDAAAAAPDAAATAPDAAAAAPDTAAATAAARAPDASPAQQQEHTGPSSASQSSQPPVKPELQQESSATSSPKSSTPLSQASSAAAQLAMTAQFALAAQLAANDGLGSAPPKQEGPAGPQPTQGQGQSPAAPGPQAAAPGPPPALDTGPKKRPAASEPRRWVQIKEVCAAAKAADGKPAVAASYEISFDDSSCETVGAKRALELVMDQLGAPRKAPAKRRRSSAKTAAMGSQVGPWTGADGSLVTPKHGMGPKGAKASITPKGGAPGKTAGRKSSNYHGVSWHTQRRRWRAYIYLSPGKQKYLGTFADQETAAHEYDKAVIEYGLRSPLNFGTRGKHGPRVGSSAVLAHAADSGKRGLLGLDQPPYLTGMQGQQGDASTYAHIMRSQQQQQQHGTPHHSPHHGSPRGASPFMHMLQQPSQSQHQQSHAGQSQHQQAQQQHQQQHQQQPPPPPPSHQQHQQRHGQQHAQQSAQHQQGHQGGQPHASQGHSASWDQQDKTTAAGDPGQGSGPQSPRSSQNMLPLLGTQHLLNNPVLLQHLAAAKAQSSNAMLEHMNLYNSLLQQQPQQQQQQQQQSPSPSQSPPPQSQPQHQAQQQHQLQFSGSANSLQAPPPPPQQHLMEHHQQEHPQHHHQRSPSVDEQRR